ncbi:uncharacterized protein [Antedon mediterranea]|uniref:uncharacterized protein n=1 Tax=Antedon mediterranea TaxID=105859 RepID=UPI003AF6B975
MTKPKYSTEHGTSNFEMKCRYGPSDMPLTGYKWKKIKEDGTTEIVDCSKDSRFEVTSYQKDNILSLKIKNVVLGDAGMYQCEVKPVDGENMLKDTKQLTVKIVPILKMEDSVNCVARGDAMIPFYVSQPDQFQNFVFYKYESDEWKKLADSFTMFGRYQVKFRKEDQSGYLEISKVKTSDDGEYLCQCVTEEKDSVTYSARSKLNVIEGYMKLNDCHVIHKDKAVLTCKYEIKNVVKAVHWYKKTADGMPIEKMPERCKATCKPNEASLEFEKVEFTDAGEYMCELKTKRDNLKGKLKETMEFFLFSGYKSQAHLSVQFDVFTQTSDNEKCSYRHPAVIFINSHFIIFCEKNNSDVIMRRGKLNGKSMIEWEEPRMILQEKDTSYHNIVPIVTNNGKVILMCVKQNNKTSERKIIRMKTYDNGDNWIGPFDIQLDLTDFQMDSLSIGDGKCLKTKKLVVAGVCKMDSNAKKLIVIISDNEDIWNILPPVTPPDATLGEHTQIIEYANDQVYISCSLEGCHQVYVSCSNDRCETFDGWVQDAFLETSPECQGGIVRLPTKSGNFYQIAMASHGNETNKDLTLHLSKDGCKTWCQFYTLGAVNAEESDLAYYSVKEGKEEAEGIVCVYCYNSETEGYNIGMQLISTKEINSNYKWHYYI